MYLKKLGAPDLFSLRDVCVCVRASMLVDICSSKKLFEFWALAILILFPSNTENLQMMNKNFLVEVCNYLVGGFNPLEKY